MDLIGLVRKFLILQGSFSLKKPPGLLLSGFSNFKSTKSQEVTNNSISELDVKLNIPTKKVTW